jgi:transposase InsO family protein
MVAGSRPPVNRSPRDRESAAARRALFEYLEPFYNGRRYSALGYLSLRPFEQQWQHETLAS